VPPCVLESSGRDGSGEGFRPGEVCHSAGGMYRVACPSPRFLRKVFQRKGLGVDFYWQSPDSKGLGAAQGMRAELGCVLSRRTARLLCRGDYEGENQVMLPSVGHPIVGSR
jgi:hypothetical protein